MNVTQLCDRYGLASKKTLYRRLEGIGLTLDKENGKVNASKEQVELLDQLNEHIGKGNPANTFIPVSPLEVLLTLKGTASHKDTASHMSSPQHNTTTVVSRTQYVDNQLSFAPEIIELICQALDKKDPLEPHSQLELVVNNQWELTTSEVKEIIGCKPRVKKGQDCYSRGSFLFYKVGRIGNESAWIVKRKYPKVEGSEY